MSDEGRDLSAHGFSDLVFCSYTLPIRQEPLGAGAAGKSAADVRAAESQTTELLFSDTACVLARNKKKAASLDTSRQGGRLLRVERRTKEARAQITRLLYLKAATNMEPCFATIVSMHGLSFRYYVNHHLRLRMFLCSSSSAVGL